MGARTKNVEKSSQATPFAEEFLGWLSSQMQGGALNDGLPGMQREAGTAIRQFTNSGGANIRDVADPSNYITALGEVNRRELGRSSADLSEMFGAQGARFGSGIGRAQTDLFREGAQDMNQTLAQLELGLNELGINRDIAAGNQQLQGLGLQSQMAMQSLMPFLQMASQGIIPEEVIASPNPWLQLGTALLGGAGQYAGAKGG
jgi:hypothetical protein